jgi:CheY-like chemotaxis protein
MKMFAAGARPRGLQLTCAVDEAVPQQAAGDAGRLRQVLVNLVGNALKFTERGGVAVRVGVEEADATTVVLRVTVSDTGIGIPAERLEAIFEPFTQADGAMTRRFGGTGLGLTISARLVELMGGRIWVESPAPPDVQVSTAGGPGSVFSFTVRLTAVEGRAAAADASRDVSAAETRAASGTRARTAVRILLAEDNPVNQKVALHMLRRRGYDVSLVTTGRDAVDLVGREAFDLVLMDVQMPEMDGFAATAAIRAVEARTGGHLTIIAMTAHSMAGDRERCLAAGMDGYLSKPIRTADLYALLDRELDGGVTEGAA